MKKPPPLLYAAAYRYTARLASAYRWRAVMPAHEPRLHSNNRANVCHYFPRGLRALRPDPDNPRRYFLLPQVTRMRGTAIRKVSGVISLCFPRFPKPTDLLWGETSPLRWSNHWLVRRKYSQTQLIFATGGLQSYQQLHVSAFILVIIRLYSFLFWG